MESEQIAKCIIVKGVKPIAEISEEEFDSLESGDKEVIHRYLIPSEDIVGHYALAQWVSAELNVGPERNYICCGGFTEYAPVQAKLDN